MPKIIPSSRRLRALQSQREHHRHEDHHLGCPNSSILLNAPRKVSFEDGHHSSSSFSASAASSFQAASTSSVSVASLFGSSSSSSSGSNSSSRSSLRRKAPSVCLVDLAGSAASAECESRDNCRSPRPSSLECPIDGRTAPSSPWGHFVDILVPMEEQEQPEVMVVHPYKRPLVASDISTASSPMMMTNNGFFGGLFDCAPSDEDDDRDEPYLTFFPKEHRQQKDHHQLRRCHTTTPYQHPYDLLPRHRRRLRKLGSSVSASSSSSSSSSSSTTATRPSFLPAFFLDSPVPTILDRETESSETQDVEKALKRLRV